MSGPSLAVLCRAESREAPVNARLVFLYPRDRRETKKSIWAGTALIRGRPWARAGPTAVFTSIKTDRGAFGKLSEKAIIEVMGTKLLVTVTTSHWQLYCTVRYQLVVVSNLLWTCAHHHRAQLGGWRGGADQRRMQTFKQSQSKLATKTLTCDTDRTIPPVAV